MTRTKRDLAVFGILAVPFFAGAAVERAVTPRPAIAKPRVVVVRATPSPYTMMRYEKPCAGAHVEATMARIVWTCADGDAFSVSVQR